MSSTIQRYAAAQSAGRILQYLVRWQPSAKCLPRGDTWHGTHATVKASSAPSRLRGSEGAIERLATHRCWSTIIVAIVLPRESHAMPATRALLVVGVAWML